MGPEFRRLFHARTNREILNNVAKKDSLVAERKTAMVSVIHELLIIKDIKNPVKELSHELLQQWMNEYPDKFFGLKDVESILNVYFFRSIKNLKFSLGLIKD